MQATEDIKKNISQIVREDYRTASIFKTFGINYCCGGNIPLEEACKQKGLAIDDVEKALQKVITGIKLPGNIQFDKWRSDFLIDYIINIHHNFLNETLPILERSLIAFANGHIKKFPELDNITNVFVQLSATILKHNEYEEETAFPYCKQVINTHRRKESYGSLFVKTFRKPLKNVVEQETNDINTLLTALRSATNNYQIPEKACTNYHVILGQMKELDNDLVQHKHLENNVLFPKILAMEKELLLL